MSFSLEFHGNKCTGCGACVVACMDYKDIDLKHQNPLRRITIKESINNGIIKVNFSSEACKHCKDAPCISRCPKGCIYENNGIIDYDNILCIGCKACALVCPHQAISFDSNNKMQKCNGCVERLNLGLLPSCVEACPQKAIILKDY